MNRKQSNGRKSAALAAFSLLTMLTLGSVRAQAQAGNEAGHATAPEIAATYTIERAQISNLGCNCFWLQGGAVEAAWPIYHGLSVAGTFGAAHASKIQPGVDLSELTYLAGPRYTLSLAPGYRTRIFGEALFGAAHGFNGVFPSEAGVKSSATSFALQTGGGIDFTVNHSFALRLPEISYVRTSLPNNGSDTQNNLRLAVGAAYRFGRR